MAIIRKNDLVKSVKNRMHVTGSVADEAVNAVLEEIKNVMVNDDVLELHGFGRFEVIEIPARQGYNPVTKQKMMLDAYRRIQFKADRIFKDQVQ